MTNNKALVKEINKAFKGTFNKFPLNHIDYMIEMAKDEGDSNATIMMEHPTDEAQEDITIEEVKSLEERLHAICTKFTNYITTEVVSSGNGYELYFLMSV